ncbi:hypothetical protein ACXIUS_24040 [Bosea thiooxidans]|nr:hypothetical protein [Bosea sp. (in: a-proteobacteria)]
MAFFPLRVSVGAGQSLRERDRNGGDRTEPDHGVELSDVPGEGGWVLAVNERDEPLLLLPVMERPRRHRDDERRVRVELGVIVDRRRLERDRRELVDDRALDPGAPQIAQGRGCVCRAARGFGHRGAFFVSA